MLGRQKQKFHAAHIGGKGQGGLQRLVRRAPPRRVTIEAEHHRVGETEQLLHMVCGTRRAQRRDRVGKAQLRQRHHVHIAFGHQRVTGFAQMRARFKQAVQLAPFAEHRRFRRIQILGFFIAQHPRAKANAFAFDIADREHHPVAKAVVALLLATVFGRRQDDQSAFHQQRIVVMREHAGQ